MIRSSFNTSPALNVVPIEGFETTSRGFLDGVGYGFYDTV
jgi:hypothetical protein